MLLLLLLWCRWRDGESLQRRRGRRSAKTQKGRVALRYWTRQVAGAAARTQGHRRSHELLHASVAVAVAVAVVHHAHSNVGIHAGTKQWPRGGNRLLVITAVEGRKVGEIVYAIV